MKINLFSLLTLIFLSGCATVKFYDDDKLTQESGIEFYSAKPYLLIERKPSKDLALKSTIIYLPDIGSPKYAKIKPGLGSSDLKLNLSNGVITSYGVITDSKIPETITALTGILGTTGTTYKSFAEAKDILKRDEDKVVEEAGDISSMQKSKLLIDAVVTDFTLMTNNSLLTTKQKSDFTNILTKLKRQNVEINRFSVKQIPNIVAELDKIITKLKAIKVDSDSNDAKDFKSKFTRTIGEITKARELLKPKEKSSDPEFELYEIIINKNKTELKRVKFPKS